MSDIRRIVLAYSGGLDTSVILRWLIETYAAEVICFVGDVGQREDLEETVHKAMATGAKDCVVRDLREEFLRDYVFPAVAANAMYQGTYLLGTPLALQCSSSALPLALLRSPGSRKIAARRCF